MKTIKLQYLTKSGRRNTMISQMSGFEGPAKQPLKSILKDGEDYIKRGEITRVYRLEIPPGGVCEVVDTQHNRECLRQLTKATRGIDDVKKYDKLSNKYTVSREEVELYGPCFKVTDGTDVYQDLETKKETYDADEVQSKIDKALAAAGIDASGVSVKPKKKVVIAEENLSEESPVVNRFARKVRDPHKIDLSVSAPPNLQPVTA